MTGALCLKSMWLIASMELNELCRHLSSFSLDLWKSRTWWVLICLCALCIVCSHMSVVACSVFHRQPCVLEGNWRGELQQPVPSPWFVDGNITFACNNHLKVSKGFYQNCFGHCFVFLHTVESPTRTLLYPKPPFLWMSGCIDLAVVN